MTMPYQYARGQRTPPKPRASSTTWGLGIVGGFFALLGLIAGFQSAGSGCGSGFFPDTRIAKVADAYSRYPGSGVAACNENIASAQSMATLCLVIAALALLVVAMVAGVRRQNRVTAGLHTRMPANQGDAPTRTHPGQAARGRLEELSGLHQQGLISDDEFQAKRTDILGQL